MRRALACALSALAIAGAAGALPQAAQAATAGSVQAPASHFTLEQAADFSKQIEDDLAGRDARVAMVFRAGRPRKDLPQGISYTHGAFFVYRDIVGADGKVLNGYAVYNLYAGDGTTVAEGRSSLVQDFPLDFTRSSTVDDVAVIVPSPEMQSRILAVIDSPTYQALHNPAYSLVANPWMGLRQNCNDFMLDVVAVAAWQTTDRAQIEANLRAHFKPTEVKVGGLALMFGPMFDKRLTLVDQSDGVKTATYESLARFMGENGLIQETYKLYFQSKN
ncbi:MAG: hypothetical protein JWM33_416 [Caulobacteraceae bacterium]|nr:hypothetical protein [Caulobacteraceae bacterium]